MAQHAVLLTVSGTIAPDVVERTMRGERPMADYIAMAKAFPADLIDYPTAQRQMGSFGKLLLRIGGPNLVLAWACFDLRKQYRAIFFDGEQVGLPYALLIKLFGGRQRPRQLMISHILSVRKKKILLDLLRLHSVIDLFFVYATSQKQFIEKRWNVPPKRVVLTPFMVDARFFAPNPDIVPFDFSAVNPRGLPMISTAGLERRDYRTLIEAVRGQNVFVVIAAASPWAKQRDAVAGTVLPENVHVQKFTQFDLRRVYAASKFVVMPLLNVDFQAGITAILEGMAMAKAIVCTRTPGQTDAVVEGETGLYVAPADPVALRETIQTLLDDPELANAMGRRGQERVQREMSLECYTHRLAEYVQRSLN